MVIAPSLLGIVILVGGGLVILGAGFALIHALMGVFDKDKPSKD